MDNLSIFLSAVIVVLVVAVILLGKRLSDQTMYARTEIDRVNREKADAIAWANATVQQTVTDANRRIEEERQRSELEMRKLREFIETQRTVLASKTDKELLVDIILAVGGYAGRIDRLEERLGEEQIQSRIRDLSTGIELLTQQTMQEIQSQLQNVNQCVQSQLQNASQGIQSEMQNASQGIQYQMQRVSGDIQSQLQTTERVIQENLNRTDIVSALSAVRSQMDDVESELNDVSGKLFNGYYGYDSLASLAEDAKSAAENAESAARNAESAAENAESAARSAESAAEDAKYAAESS